MNRFRPEAAGVARALAATNCDAEAAVRLVIGQKRADVPASGG